MIRWLLLLAVVTVTKPLFSSAVVEEINLHGPMEFHDLAMGEYIQERRKDPNYSIDYDSDFMKKAREHAVKRMMIKSEDQLTIPRISLGAPSEDGEQLGLLGHASTLKLPSPDVQEDHLKNAVTTQGSYGSALMLPEQANALAFQFNEEVAFGAISKAGALPMGEDSKWLSFAEDKMKRDNRMDHQSLLWEYGAAVAEAAAKEKGGLNVTAENELLENMKVWFAKGGGKLRFADPSITKENGFQLLATEDIIPDEVILSVPMKLIMCRQTARNVLIHQRGKYLGEELAKTFEKDEAWGLAIFLLHEYFKEMTGVGSKWGPFIRTLSMRMLTTETLQALKGTTAAQMAKSWLKGADSFMWWTTGADGPCSPTTGICRTKPNEKFGDSRFNIHHMRWAYFVVKQNSVKIKHIATGLEFLALIPFYNMFEKKMDGGGGVSFDLDGSISVRAGDITSEGGVVALNPGNLTDPEYFMRYLRIPQHTNYNNLIKLSLPGALPKGSKFHYCMKGSFKDMNRDECKGSYRSESMFWKSKVLGEWRTMMNLPPRMQELRMWATRLHLYGTDEEMKLMSAANQMIAGLPIPVDQMPAEEQLMMMGVARDNTHAMQLVAGSTAERPPPQLYSAPDPEEDPEAQRAMENLATLALQAQTVVATGNVMYNATQAVLNHTRDFFLHGVLPMAGLDELDEFLLKKIGMLAHCGFENNMKITYNNITDELMCAMRVHLMNETEMFVFCPKEARPWEENCHNVEFANFTAISASNEQNVISALRSSIQSMLGAYPTTRDEDSEILLDVRAGIRGKDGEYGPIMLAAIGLRMREKEMLLSALDFLDNHEAAVVAGNVTYQLEEKALERLEADKREAAHKLFIEEVQRQAAIREPIATLEVDLGPKSPIPKANLTLEEGNDLKETILLFCQKYSVGTEFVSTLETALRKRIRNPVPLQLLMGVVVPTGDRRILGIPEGTNATVATGVFCAKYNITEVSQCDTLQMRVKQRLEVDFNRRVLITVPLDAPDGRKLMLQVREGEQHDLLQFVSDFFEFYRMHAGMVLQVANIVNDRLPGVAMQIPVGLGSKRQVTARFSLNENITAVVEGFANYFEIDDGTKLAILKRARHGMAPGTFLV